MEKTSNILLIEHDAELAKNIMVAASELKLNLVYILVPNLDKEGIFQHVLNTIKEEKEEGREITDVFLPYRFINKFTIEKIVEDITSEKIAAELVRRNIPFIAYGDSSEENQILLKFGAYMGVRKWDITAHNADIILKGLKHYTEEGVSKELKHY